MAAQGNHIQPLHLWFISVCLRACLILSLSAQLFAEPATDEKPVISGAFNLKNHRGDDVTKASYEGQYRLVFFGFTQCPDICPTTMVKMTEVMRKLGEHSHRVKPLFISIDIEHDSIEQLAKYVGYFHPAIDGLTGTSEQVKTASENFNASYGKIDKELVEVSNGYFHSSYIYLMDPQGDLLDLFSYATPAEQIFQQIQSLL